jgi:hypothetical protein
VLRRIVYCKRDLRGDDHDDQFPGAPWLEVILTIPEN